MIELYEIMKTEKGPRYTHNKRLISRSDIPERILDKVLIQDLLNDLDPHKCIFDGSYTKLSRLINQESIALCDEHYYDKTVGQVVQHVRQLALAKEQLPWRDTNQNQPDEALSKPLDNPKPPVISKRLKKRKAKGRPLGHSKISLPSAGGSQSLSNEASNAAF